MEVIQGIFILSAFLIALSWRKIGGFSKKYFKSDHNSDLDIIGAETWDRLPTPPSLPILGNLLHVLKPGLDHLKLGMELTQKYGNILKITVLGEKLVYLNEPSMIQKILNSSNPKHMNKYRKLYDIFLTGHLVNGLIASEHNVWHPHRRIMSRAFNFQSLQSRLTLMNKHAKVLVQNLGQVEKQENIEIGRREKIKGLNISDKIHGMVVKFVLDTIMEIDECTKSELTGFYESNDVVLDAIGERLQKPWLLLGPIFMGRTIWDFHPIEKKIQRANNICDKLLRKMISKYKNKIETGKSGTKVGINDEDLLSRRKRYKCLMEELLESGLDENEVLEEAMTIITAGHETTSGSLMFLLFQLALNIEIQEKCRKEIDQLFDSKLTTDDPHLTMDDLTNLKYLERCVLENLRICPVIPAFGRRLDAPLEISDNMVLPQGITVIIAPWTLHRDPENFPDPERFDPDRFLPENCKKRHAFAYLPFSSGSRNCIGWKTALMTLKVITAFILRNYRIETSDKWEDVDFVYKLSLATKKKINLYLVKRH